MRTPHKSAILLVEDDHSVRRTLARYLATSGFAVTATADAERAFELLEGRQYDLVLADVHLPGASGLELLRLVLADPPSCPIVMVTGDPDPEVERVALAAGAAAYLRKPFAFEELAEVLTRLPL